MLQNLSSHSDSSGEESGGEEEKKEVNIDEDDLAEQAKLPQYVSRFKVGVCYSLQVSFCFIGLLWNGFESVTMRVLCYRHDTTSI